MAPGELQVLAIDPGPSNMGWAHLSVSHGRGVRCTYAGSGYATSSREMFGMLLASTRADAMVVEAPAGYAFQPARVPMLLRTSQVAGGMLWLAEHRGLRTAQVTAQQVRKVLAGKATADDALVRDVVQRNVFGCPARPGEHQADALAAGVLGAWMFVGQVVLPPVPEGKPKKRKGAK